MPLDIKEYHFSKKKILLFSLFLVLTFSAFTYLITKTSQVSPILAIIQVVLATWVMIFILPMHLRFTYYLLIKRPALILSSDLLTDNMNRRQYMWSEVKKITYKRNAGVRTFGGFIAIELIENAGIKGSKYVIERLRMRLTSGATYLAIPYMTIDCDKQELLTTLNKYKRTKQKLQQLT